MSCNNCMSTIRATTPFHKFIFPVDPRTFHNILITYKQLGKIVLELHQEDLIFAPDTDDVNSAYHLMTQEETNLFIAGHPVKVQVRVIDSNGLAFASKIMPLEIKPVLNSEVLHGL